MNTTVSDPFSEFKVVQKERWAHFAAYEVSTIPTAGQLVKFARVQSGMRVLDVGCGSGVVAVSAALKGAKVSGLDLTPALLERAKYNAEVANVNIDFTEGDVEFLPYKDAEFDMVLSQFGHIFAPRPEVAISEMLRVLKPGGVVAFSSWPPEHFNGKNFALIAKYLPKPKIEIPATSDWGNVQIVQQRLGSRVKDLRFERNLMPVTALSPAHFRINSEKHTGVMIHLVQTLKDDPEKLAAFRKEFELHIAEHLEDNIVKQHYLMTRAVKL